MVVTVHVCLVTGLDGPRDAKFALSLNVCLERWNVTKVNTNASSSPLSILGMFLGCWELPIKPFILGIKAGEATVSRKPTVDGCLITVLRESTALPHPLHPEESPPEP